MSKLLSIVIVTFGQAKMTKECLVSIEKNNDLGDMLEIIISDNSLDDEVEKMIQESYPQYPYTRNGNVGFGRGNNIGFSQANGKYVLFLNPDTLIKRPIFREAVSMFDKEEKLGMFGVNLVDANQSRLISYSLRPEYCKGSVFVENFLIKLCNKRGYFYSKMFPFGAALFVRAQAFLDAGMFDENIFMYFEEPDLCNRMEERGYRIDYCKNIEITHLIGKTSTDKPRQLKIELDSLKYYAQKYNFDFMHLVGQRKKLTIIKNMVRKIENYDEVISIYDAVIEEKRNNEIKDNRN